MPTLGRTWASMQSQPQAGALRIAPMWSAATAARAGTALVRTQPVVQSRSAARIRRVPGASRSVRRTTTRLRQRLAAAALACCRSCAGAVGSAFSLERAAELSLVVAAAISLLLLSRMVSPDSAVMRLAQGPVSIVLPEVTDHNLLFRSSPSLSDEGDTHSDLQPVDASQFQRLQVNEYRLVSGDTLSGIAVRNGLRIDTLASFNKISDARRIRVGDLLQIPNRDGLLHNVGRGESLSSIASRYGTTVNALLDSNDLNSATIAVGQKLFVPGARLSRNDLQRVLGQLFVYPANGRFTSGFGMRNDPFTGIRRFHNGIDLAGPTGTPVRAAMAGRVVHIENQPGNYGRFVIIRHDGGYQTLYAHLDTHSVRTGQQVNQGQQIGMMGDSGRSTGAHLHFSVIKNGSFVDPMRYLR